MVLILAASVAATAPMPADAASGQRLDLRVLLVSNDGNEPQIAAWRTQLQLEGVPFRELRRDVDGALTWDRLTLGPTWAAFNGVVLASDGLLSPDEMDTLATFQRTFGVRVVDAYVYPTPSVGLSYPTFAGDLAGTVATLTKTGAKTFGYLRGPVPVDQGAWGYLANPLDASFTTLVAAPSGQPLVGVKRHPDGREELVVTVATNQFQIHQRLLAHGLLNWVTKGLHLGINRNYFTLHVDDVFLPNDRWDTEANTTHEDDCTTLPCIRMTPADVDRAVKWSTANKVKLDLAFNGLGSVEAAAANGGSDPLTRALLANKDKFRWVNHTYDHANLDAASLDAIVGTIRDNVKFARANRIPIRAAELVTGEHSGLANPAMPSALAATGITAIAADASRQPDQYTIGPARTVPRHPSNVYYNVGTFAEQLDEYNYLYLPPELGGACVPTPVTTCLSRPATYEEFLASESRIMLGHILGNDPRPNYAHQSNLAEDGTLYPLLDAVMGRYRTWFKVGLTQPTMTQVAELLADIASWTAAVDTVEAYVIDGVVTIVGTGVDVPLTTPSGTLIEGTTRQFGSAWGGERSDWVSLASGATLRLVLPAA
jgi:hypothetical protein